MSKKIVQQNDHIILPKATLMRFADERKQIHYLDLNDRNALSVKRAYPKSYHASLNYYHPEYDDIVKRQETAMGKLYADISTALARHSDVDIRAEELRASIINFVTIEFHRCVIASSTLLEKYRNKQQRENDQVDSMLFRTGRMTKERGAYSEHFRQKAKSEASFRSYAQNILGTSNPAISNCYHSFSPKILYIPSGSADSFFLPPFHFVGNDQFVCFILSPNIALALYPVPAENPLLLEADKERVEIINLRVLEGASLLDSGFREIVGEKARLEQMQRRIENVKSVAVIGEHEIIVHDRQEFCLRTMEQVLEFLIILTLFSSPKKGACKVRMKTEQFDTRFWEERQPEIAKIFQQYSFELVV